MTRYLKFKAVYDFRPIRLTKWVFKSFYIKKSPYLFSYGRRLYYYNK